MRGWVTKVKALSSANATNARLAHTGGAANCATSTSAAAPVVSAEATGPPTSHGEPTHTSSYARTSNVGAQYASSARAPHALARWLLK